MVSLRNTRRKKKKHPIASLVCSMKTRTKGGRRNTPADADIVIHIDYSKLVIEYKKIGQIIKKLSRSWDIKLVHTLYKIIFYVKKTIDLLPADLTEIEGISPQKERRIKVIKEGITSKIEYYNEMIIDILAGGELNEEDKNVLSIILTIDTMNTHNILTEETRSIMKSDDIQLKPTASIPSINNYTIQV